MHISIVIPTFNEENRIGNTIVSIIEYLRRSRKQSEIIVADDGSKDNTIYHVSNKYDPVVPISILSHSFNMGKGAAVKRGMMQATGDVVLFTDADLSTPIEELDRLLVELDKGFDVVIGSRGMAQSILEKRQPFYRQFMGKTFNKMVQFVVLPGIQDTQCGFKLFSRRAVNSLFPEQMLTGFAFDVEILYMARKKGLKIKEVPVTWHNATGSKVHIVRDSLKMFWNMLLIRLMH